ncbi:MAG: hypothetical protein K5886_11495 [Lachnospiraceae bacterium]|nr:hypothetical protein [Lachnospiraceae bacterium]
MKKNGIRMMALTLASVLLFGAAFPERVTAATGNGGKTETKVSSEPSMLPLYWGSLPFWPENDEDYGDGYSYSTGTDIYTADKDEYPELAKALEKMVGEIEDYYRDLLPLLKKQTDRVYKASDDEWLSVYQEGIFNLCRADENVLSFVYYDNFSGIGDEADPSSYALGVNLDPDTGKSIDLFDVITSKEDLIKAVDKEIADADIYVDEWKAEARKCVKSALTDDVIYSGAESGLSFTIDYNGLMLYFNGEDTGFDDGPCSLLISFSEYPKLFEKKYMSVPESYFTELMTGDFEYIHWFDLDGDGDPEPFALLKEEHDDVDYEYDMSLAWGSSVEELKEAEYFYYANAFLLHEPDMDCIYVETTTENDYQTVHVYEITEDGPEYTGSQEGSLKFNMYPDDEDEPIGYIPNDPESFKMSTTDWTMGTNWLIGDYSAGEDGMPVQNDHYLEYTNTDYLHIKAVTDIDARYMTEGSRKSRKGTIKKGSYVIPYLLGQDDELLVKTEDDRIWTLELEEDEDGYYTYDDERIIDLFEGLSFAG